jgi:hypothetical protein
MLAYIPLIAGEVKAVSAVLISIKLTWMAPKSVHKTVTMNAARTLTMEFLCLLWNSARFITNYSSISIHFFHCSCMHPLISGPSSFLFVVVLKTI